MYPPRSADGAMTPTGTAEWNTFIQSNPQIEHSTSMSRDASPALSQAPPQMSHERTNSFSQSSQPQPMPNQENNMPAEPGSEASNQQSRPRAGRPSRKRNNRPLRPEPIPAPALPTLAPMPAEPPSETGVQGPTSRPSSRLSNRPAGPRRQRTGRPVGRPRKLPLDGNTSGYEEGTEGEDGPPKKRAKVTQVERASPNAFGTEPESLRVAASTSGSLRNFRPIGMNQETAGETGEGGSHLQEVPRAPTPVPMGPFPGRGQKVRGDGGESAGSRELSAKLPSPQHRRLRPLSPSQEDGRSPESAAQTPAYSDDNPTEIGSSPPVPRARSFMQSSPPPSSPVLPPMPGNQTSQDDSLDTGESGDLFGADEQAREAVVGNRAAPPVPLPKKGQRQRIKESNTNITTQIFRMEDGPDGSQDMVYLRSRSTPHPSAAAPNDERDSKTQDPSQTQLFPCPQPSVFGPTPPQTTDAFEKPTSPPAPENQPDAPPQQAPGPGTATPNQSNLGSGPNPEGGIESACLQSPAPQPDSATLPDSVAGPAPQSQGESTEASGNPNAQATSLSSAGQLRAEEVAKSKKRAPSKSNNSRARPRARKLARSQSAGPLALASAPASEPAGPSALSQSITAEGVQPAAPSAPPNFRRATSSGPLSVPVPASDPIGPSAASNRQTHMLALPEPPPPPAEVVPPPPSSPRASKNIVKKNAIKQKLEAAIQRGEMPPFCSNCGAIQTPTWRKVYSQDREGVPPLYGPKDFSTKPGMVTAMEILKRDDENKPTAYRLIKKNLAPEDDRCDFQEDLLCNPCGIWLGKCFSHRPQDRWEGDAARLGQERKRRSDSGTHSRGKKSRSKSVSQMNLTSEAFTPRDGPESVEPRSSVGAENSVPAMGVHDDDGAGIGTSAGPNDAGAGNGQGEAGPRSTHSSGSGAAKSPIDQELDSAMGSTKRLLFPSPRKDGSPHVLGEVSINIVRTETECRQPKDLSAKKENISLLQTGAVAEGDDLEDLFRSPIPPPRPSTPPSKTRAAPPTTPFKTPTPITPSRRPITRSVSRSMQSKGSLGSPMAAFNRTPSRTPSKTPRGELGLLGSVGRRRSPRNHSHHDPVDFDDNIFDTPVSRAVNQMLSEPNFGLDDEMELVNLETAAATDPNWANFGSTFFSTDAPMPSSPPRDRISFGVDQPSDTWEWNLAQLAEATKE